jgi:hypothetical protein
MISDLGEKALGSLGVNEGKAFTGESEDWRQCHKTVA